MKEKLLGLAACALIALPGCGGSLEASQHVRKGPATGDAFQVEMADNVFEPSTIRAESGEEITLEISNVGRTVHNLVIPKLEVSSGLVQSDEVVTATFVMPDSEIEFVCTLHRGMEGKLAPEIE